MSSSEKKPAHNRSLVTFGACFTALTAVVPAALFGIATQGELNATYDLSQEAVSSLEKAYDRFSNTSAGYSAKALQSLRDIAQGFSEFLPADKVDIDDELATEFIRAEHISGLIVLDSDLQPIAQADLNEKDPYGLWSETIHGTAVHDVLQNRSTSYSDVLFVGKNTYNVTVIPYGNDMLLMAYESLSKPASDPYEFTISDLVSQISLHGDPTILMMDADGIVSTSEPGGKRSDEEYDELRAESQSWPDDSLARVTYGGDTFYGTCSSYKQYQFYILYPESGVFSGRTLIVAFGTMVYLAICLVILIVRGYTDRKALRTTQKQLRIINAIGATYSTVLLFHLDTMQMEPLRIPEKLKDTFDEIPHPIQFAAQVCRDYIAPESREAVMEAIEPSTMESRLEGRALLSTDIQDQGGHWYSLQVIPQRRDDQGKLLAVIVATRDVTAEKRAEELSFRDKLTGLRNRNYLESRGEEFVRSGDLPVTVFMADCNYLKRTNDTMGHEWGDELLKRVASVLSAAVPGEGLAMRIGGDEFLLVCPHMDERGGADLAQKIEARLAEKSDDDLTLSVSLGRSTVTGPSTTFAEAFKAADEAMYVAKKEAHARG